MPETPFIDALESSEKPSGIFLTRNFLPDDQADRAFSILNDNSKFPWNHNPVLFGEALTQHAYQYERGSNPNDHEGLRYVEKLCEQIEEHFDVEVYDVTCNRFHDPEHQIEWHRDTYGAHIFVLTLGSERNIQFQKLASVFRPCQKREVETVRPKTGDIYFMPLQLNKTHQHQVCPADDIGISTKEKEPRISLVFFVEAPEYATDFKISACDRFVGSIQSFLE